MATIFLAPMNTLLFLTPWDETLAVGADHQNLRHSKNPAVQKVPPLKKHRQSELVLHLSESTPRSTRS